MSSKKQTKPETRLRRGLTNAEYMRVWRDVNSGKLTDEQAVALGLWLPKPEKAGGRPRKPRRKIAPAKRTRRQKQLA